MTVDLQECLPLEMRGPGTTITKIDTGLSGAGVYQVLVDGRQYALKVAPASESHDTWLWAMRVQLMAAEAHLTPKVVHVDDKRRAVLTAFVTARSFPQFYGNATTHAAAVALLGRTARRIHKLPIPKDALGRDPRAFLSELRSGIDQARFALPEYASQAIDRALAEPRPPATRKPVLSHNDLNPTNFIYDGEAIQVVDWAVADRNDPFYDLAVLAVFLRMPQATCLVLLSAYDGHRIPALPPEFVYFRRLVGALAGTAQLNFARLLKHPGASAEEDYRHGTVARRVLPAATARPAEAGDPGRALGLRPQPDQGESGGVNRYFGRREIRSSAATR